MGEKKYWPKLQHKVKRIFNETRNTHQLINYIQLYFLKKNQNDAPPRLWPFGDAAFSTPCPVRLQNSFRHNAQWTISQKLRQKVHPRTIMTSTDNKLLFTHSDDTDPWKVICSSSSKYVNEDIIECAISEHLAENGKEDRRTLVAEDINLHHFLFGSRLGEIYHHVHFHAEYKGRVMDEKTPADRYIVKMQQPPHESIVHAVSYYLNVYTSSEMGSCLGVSGGNMALANEVRRADLTLCPALPGKDEDPSMPRFLVEVEVHHRSGPAADAWCRGYFPLIPQLQTVLLIKVYPRSESGCFGALAVLYRRERPDSGSVVVEDAVSFGTEFLSAKARSPLKISSPEILAKLRMLPEVPVGPGQVAKNPWDDACRPYILLRHEDLFHWKIVDNGTRRFLPGYVSRAAKDCKVELWRVMDAINRFTVI